jgi:Ca-activated chloride channel family protein
MISPSKTRSTFNNETSRGLCALDGTLLALKKLIAEGKLRNELLEMSVEQHYQNSSAANLEAVYTFPLMPDAVLLGLELIIGDRHLFGVSVPVAEARHSYEQALEDGNSAVMLEKATDGLYTVNIGNLLAGESACIRYQYAQPIATKNGTMRITIPTTVPPRYGNSAAQLQPHQAPESDVLAEYPFRLSVHIEGESNPAVITSPTHKTTLSRAEDGTTINFPAAHLDRDAVIMVKRAQRTTVYIAETSAGCIAYAPVAASLPEESRPLAATSLRLVIDCSGSMAGASILSARRGAMRAIETLTEADEFSITRFGSRFEHYRARLLKVSFGIRAMALRYLHSTDATLGGTEMQSALMAASQLVAESKRSDVLLVTDGEIWEIDALVHFARDTGMRYFIVGVGFSPSHENLSQLAECTGGAYVAATPGEDIEQAIVDVMTRIKQPSICNAHLGWSTESLWQTRMPDTLSHFARPQCLDTLRFRFCQRPGQYDLLP